MTRHLHPRLDPVIDAIRDTEARRQHRIRTADTRPAIDPAVPEPVYDDAYERVPLVRNRHETKPTLRIPVVSMAEEIESGELAAINKGGR